MLDINGLLVTHKWAEIGDLEELCKPDAVDILESLFSKESVEEAFAIQTCNRAEFYVASSNGGRNALKDLEDELDMRDGLPRYKGHSDSVRHLMRLACGLESMVIGEDEILGQLKDAYHTAEENGYIGDTLEKTLMKAIHVGEEARTRTAINEGNASMGSAAVEVAKDHLESLSDSRVLVIGAGDMGELVSKSLVNRDKQYDQILVANRTYERAEYLAEKIGGEAVKFASLDEHLEDTDIVVTATTAPHYIFDKSDLEEHDFLILDLANPRDIHPDADKLDSVDLVDIDDLSEVSDSSMERRKEAAERVEDMIDKEIEVLDQQFKQEKAMDMLSRIYSHAESLREEETEEAIEKLRANTEREITEEEVEIINNLTQSLVNQLLSDPTQALKKAAESEDYETLKSASQIFRLSESATKSPFVSDGSPETQESETTD